MHEQILVVPRTFLFANEKVLHGFRLEGSKNLLKRIAFGSFFISRHQAEYDLNFKQIIIYLVLRFRDSIFVYQRKEASLEKRLIFRHSLGLGGHINPCPVKNFKQLIFLNLNRELREEVYLKKPYSYHFFGIVNDEQNKVGKHHLGLVFLVSCSSPEIITREKKKLTGKLVPASRLPFNNQLENWSLLILPEIMRMFK